MARRGSRRLGTALGSITVAPAQPSLLPRSNSAEMQLPLEWRVAAGQHEDRAERDRVWKRSWPLLLGSAAYLYKIKVL